MSADDLVYVVAATVYVLGGLGTWAVARRHR